MYFKFMVQIPHHLGKPPLIQWYLKSRQVYTLHKPSFGVGTKSLYIEGWVYLESLLFPILWAIDNVLDILFVHCFLAEGVELILVPGDDSHGLRGLETAMFKGHYNQLIEASLYPFLIQTICQTKIVWTSVQEDCLHFEMKK